MSISVGRSRSAAEFTKSRVRSARVRRRAAAQMMMARIPLGGEGDVAPTVLVEAKATAAPLPAVAAAQAQLHSFDLRTTFWCL
mmetsp:Transcript_50143/g.133194  ORF Transcript_50143/g.133194 Transcript_50143/m.133194 type:complete len:83 (-) Transcript_50143:222-470(-)